MARYIQDVVLNKPDDFVAFIMNDYLQKNGFTMADWKGEPAFRAGDPMFEGYKFLKWSYANGVFHLEAWLKGTFGGEWDLEGFVAIAQKKPFKDNLNELITILQQTIPQPGMSADPNAPVNPDGSPAPTVIPVHTIDNQNAATIAFIMGILSIVFAFIVPYLSIIFAVICFMQARMGQASSKANLAKAGKICCIIGLCLAIAMWVLNIVIAIVGAALGAF